MRSANLAAMLALQGLAPLAAVAQSDAQEQPAKKPLPELDRHVVVATRLVTEDLQRLHNPCRLPGETQVDYRRRQMMSRNYGKNV